jgi:hypothetical protein
MSNIKHPGINVQAPWARLLLEQKKQIETRTYPLPAKYVGKDLWLIETPGSLGKFKARVIGVIRFAESKEYGSKDEFNSDIDLHLVHPDNQEYRWRAGIRKFGWIVESVCRTEEFEAPFPRGIVYASPFESPVGRQR